MTHKTLADITSTSQLCKPPIKPFINLNEIVEEEKSKINERRC
jgi:hypothetical protein